MKSSRNLWRRATGEYFIRNCRENPAAGGGRAKNSFPFPAAGTGGSHGEHRRLSLSAGTFCSGHGLYLRGKKSISIQGAHCAGFPLSGHCQSVSGGRRCCHLLPHGAILVSGQRSISEGNRADRQHSGAAEGLYCGRLYDLRRKGAGGIGSAADLRHFRGQSAEGLPCPCPQSGTVRTGGSPRRNGAKSCPLRRCKHHWRQQPGSAHLYRGRE